MNNISFSAYTKNELSKLNNLKNKPEVLAELYGYLSTANYSYSKRNAKYSTENEYNINRFAKLLNNTNINDYSISFQGKNYTITIKQQQFINQAEIKEKIKSINEENLQKEYVRGTFLGSGYISNPENEYHLEVIFKDKIYAEIIIEILRKYFIIASIIEKKNTVSIYIKDSDEISKFLAFIGAGSSVLKFEEIRVMREMKNNVNRLVNCETANLNKTISASVEQINIIKKIRKNKKFDKLPQDLKDISILREKNPNATLDELGKMLEKPIGKSTVSNRFKRLKDYI